MRGGYLPRSAVAIAPRPDVGIDSLGKLSARGIPSRNYGSWLFCGLPDQSTTALFLLRYAYDHCGPAEAKRRAGLVSYMPLAAAGRPRQKHCLLAATFVRARLHTLAFVDEVSNQPV